MPGRVDRPERLGRRIVAHDHALRTDRRHVAFLVEAEGRQLVGSIALSEQAPRQHEVAPSGAVTGRRRRIQTFHVGRAPSTKVTFEMNTFPLRGSDAAPAKGGVVSPGCRCARARLSARRCIQRPARDGHGSGEYAPVADGCIEAAERGDAAAVLDTRFNVTAIGPTVFAAPVSVSVMEPVALPDAGRLLENPTGNTECGRTRA